MSSAHVYFVETKTLVALKVVDISSALLTQVDSVEVTFEGGCGPV